MNELLELHPPVSAGGCLYLGDPGMTGTIFTLLSDINTALKELSLAQIERAEREFLSDRNLGIEPKKIIRRSLRIVTALRITKKEMENL